jgi:glucose 1-dehydrogenase
MKVVHVVPGHAHSLRVSAREEPRCAPDQVKLRVLEVGLDGTDRDILEGYYGEPPRGSETLIIGHECLATVESLGADVRGWKAGDLAVPTVRRPDDCSQCARGEYDYCSGQEYHERGIRREDGFLQAFIVEEPRFLIKVPEKARDYAILTEPLSIIEKAIASAYTANSRFAWKPRQALITGDGTIGILAAFALRLRGFDVVMTGLGADERKEALLREEGIIRYDAKRYPLSWIAQEHGAPDLIIEATGSSAVALEAIQTVGVNGVVVLTSITPRKNRMDVGMSALNNRLVLGNRTVIGSVNASKHDFTAALATLHELEETHAISRIITARYPIEHIAHAIRALANNIKIVIDVAR